MKNKLSESDIAQAKAVDLIGLADSFGLKLQKKNGEFFAHCPFHEENTPSFSIKPDTNRFYCFGCGAGEEGGDTVEFVERMKGIPFVEAVRYLTGDAGAPDGFMPKKAPRKMAAVPTPEWKPLPDAQSAPTPPSQFKMRRQGDLITLNESRRWAYRGPAGELMGYVVRFDHAGGKDVIPQVYCVNTETGECAWRWLSFDKPRPIYGLDLLAGHPRARVLVVEGEKAADAARERVALANIKPDALVVVAWPGGGKGVKHVDWSPLAGRKVALWPDADQKVYASNHELAGIQMPLLEQPGMRAMLDIYERIRESAALVKIVLPPDYVPDGWDLADDDPVDFDFRTHLQAASMDPESILQDNEPEIPVAPLEDFDARADDQTGIEGDEAIDSRGYFRILGYDHGRYFVLQEEGRQIHELTKADFTDAGMVELAPPEWWMKYFPSEKGGISKAFAFNWFVRRARAMGIYDPSRMRGRGAWIDNGRVVLHVGRWLYVDGVRTDPTKIASQYVYELDRALPDLHAEGLTLQERQTIFEIACRFRWARPANAALLVGWLALAPLCGAIKWRPHIWLTGGAGSGKAQPHSSNVLTPDGWRKMGDMAVGDYVRTPDNKYGRVFGVFPQGKVPVFKVTFSDGRVARATGDHLWKVRVKHAWRLRTTAEMAEVMARKTRASVNMAVPVCAPLTIEGNKKIEYPIHPYVLGALIGDGGLTQDTIRFTNIDKDIIEKFSSLLPDGMKAKSIDVNFNQFRINGLDRYGKSMRSLIKDLRLLGKGSVDKFIPAAYLNGSIESRMEILKGLMDTDGHIGVAGSLSYCTISEQLRDDVVSLVRSLGGIAAWSTRSPIYTNNGEKKFGKTAYVINIRFPDQKIAFSCKRKLDRANSENQYFDCFYLNVESIEADGEEECSCIAIDHPDRLYVTDNYVVTHNTTVLNEYLSFLLGDWGLFAQGNSTEAGIRQTLRKDARPVLIDETESNEERDKTRVQSILGLIRQSSSESAAMTLKGTTFGSSMHFQVRSMFALASIQVALKQQADLERLSVLSLRPKHEEIGAAENWQVLSEALEGLRADETLPSRLHRRCVDLLPITVQNIKTFCRVGAEKWGTQRDGDQYGTLMAGCWSMLNDGVASPDQARKMLDAYTWDDHMDHLGNDEAQMALADLLGQQVQVSSALRMTVYEMIQYASGHGSEVEVSVPETDVAAVLARYGIRIDFTEKAVAIANRLPPPMAELMAKSQFGADLRGQLMRLKGAYKSPNVVRFAGEVGRATMLPWEHVLPSTEFGLTPPDFPF